MPAIARVASRGRESRPQPCPWSPEAAGPPSRAGLPKPPCGRRGRGYIGGVLHLIKLSVGPKDVGQLREIQARRAVADPPLRHQTRMVPKRAAEILAGGSIYWVVAGFVQVRQRILDIRDEAWDD